MSIFCVYWRQYCTDLTHKMSKSHLVLPMLAWPMLGQ